MDSNQPLDPFYPNQPEKAFVVLDANPIGVGVVTRGYSGYGIVYDYTVSAAELGYEAVRSIARDCVQKYNDALGLTAAQVMAARIGSMRGWFVPGANPAAWAGRNRIARTKRPQ